MQTIAGLQTCNCATHLERIFLRWSNDHQALQPIPVEWIMICAVGTCMDLSSHWASGRKLLQAFRVQLGGKWQQAVPAGYELLSYLGPFGRLHESQHQWMSVRKQLVTRCPSFHLSSLYGMFVTVKLLKFGK